MTTSFYKDYPQSWAGDLYERREGMMNIFGTKECTQCTLLKKMLDGMGYDYTYYDLAEESDEASYARKQAAKEGARTLPFVFLNLEFLGSTPEAIAYAKDHIGAA